MFPRIDKDDVRRQVDLVRNAKVDGSNDKPPENSSDLSRTELRIQKRCEDQLSEYRQTLRQETDAYVERRNSAIGSLNVDPEELTEQSMVDGVVAEWKKKVGPITSSARDVENFAEQLRHFRIQHGLGSWLPDCKDVWRLVWMLLGIFVGELIVTAFLLRETGGLPMILIISIVYCLLNCIVPFFFGPAFRETNYNSGHYIRKFGGWLVLLLMLALGLLLNLLMGHYRSVGIELRSMETAGADMATLAEMTQFATNVSATALRNFLASPVGIADTLSWLLAAVGCFAFFFSFWDGYKRDDTYPRYGKFYKKYRKQLQQYDHDVEELVDELKTRRDAEVKRVVARSAAIRDALSKVTRLENDIASLTKSYASACELLDSDFRELVEEYRGLNQAERISASPAYFGRKETLQIAKAAPPELLQAPNEDTMLARMRELESFSVRLNKAFDTLTTEVRPSSEILSNPPDRITQETN